MQVLIIVDDQKEWPLKISGAQVVSARDYLTDPSYQNLHNTKIFNLCTSYKYQTSGYYVSLLATARGHKPVPSVTTIQDMKSHAIIRLASDDLNEIIQHSLMSVRASEFTLSIYFGRNLAKKYDRLSNHLCRLFHAPLLRAHFALNSKWNLVRIGPISASEIPANHMPYVVEFAKDFFAGRHARPSRRSERCYDLAILYSPQDPTPPSNEKAIQKFIKAAESIGINADLIEKTDYSRLAEYDALFIRETTSMMHHTYRFARRAVAEGLVVIDDPESIVKCTNKVYQQELAARHKIRTPKTLIIHCGNVDLVEKVIGFPCVLKLPDGSFSRGVIKVDDRPSLMRELGTFLEKSELVIVQEFIPTEFDWRIGVIDHKPLYACKYYMARRHWQIYKQEAGQVSDGEAECIHLDQVPKAVLNAALKAANGIGDGLYGVDLKQVGSKVYMIEVNDNPNIDAKIEDELLKDQLYKKIMEVFLKRLEQKTARAKQPRSGS